MPFIILSIYSSLSFPRLGADGHEEAHAAPDLPAWHTHRPPVSPTVPGRGHWGPQGEGRQGPLAGGREMPC